MVDAGLERFVEAQRGVHEHAVRELREGRKTSHWIWFELPQLRGLGRSPTATAYGIASAEEARAYLAHPVLGPRLRECVAALLEVAPDRSAVEVLGEVDAMKARSSMTLFAAVSPDEQAFRAVLDAWFDGVPDPLTLALLAGRADA